MWVLGPVLRASKSLAALAEKAQLHLNYVGRNLETSFLFFSLLLLLSLFLLIFLIPVLESKQKALQAVLVQPCPQQGSPGYKGSATALKWGLYEYH